MFVVEYNHTEAVEAADYLLGGLEAVLNRKPRTVEPVAHTSTLGATGLVDTQQIDTAVGYLCGGDFMAKAAALKARRATASPA